MHNLMNLKVGEYYAIRMEGSKEDQFCYCSAKTIHNEYTHSYFMVFENDDEESIHDCASYVWDRGYCNRDKPSPLWPRGGLISCRKLLDDEVYKFKMKLNNFNKVRKQ